MYRGWFQDNQITGEGKMTWPNGHMYDGLWTNGKFDGGGKYTENYKAEKVLMKQGIWDCGELQLWT